MWISQLTRADILRRVSQPYVERVGVSRSPEERLPGPPEDECAWAIWETEPPPKSFLPPLLVVRDEEHRDFLAWVTTFLPSYRPFTAHFRVLKFTTFENLHFKKSPDVTGLSGACLGAILGEILSAAKSRKVLDLVTTQALGSTFSFSMARAVSIYNAPYGLTMILNQWCNVRQLAMQKELTIPPEELHRVWSVLCQLYDDESMPDETMWTLVTACSEIRKSEFIAPTTFSDLTNRRLPFSIIEEIASSPKEVSVLLLEKAIGNISREYREPNNGFILGYLVSLLGNTLDYADILFPFLDRSNDALLWYGICVGLRAPDALVGKIGGIARRILRDIEFSFCLFDPPDSDLSAEELLMLLRSETAPRFARTSFNSVKVDLLPGVSTTVSWDAKESSVLPTMKKRTEQPEQLRLSIPTARTDDQILSVLIEIESKLSHLNSNDVLKSLAQFQTTMETRLDQIEQLIVPDEISTASENTPPSKSATKPNTKAVSLSQLQQNRAKKKARKK